MFSRIKAKFVKRMRYLCVRKWKVFLVCEFLLSFHVFLHKFHHITKINGNSLKIGKMWTGLGYGFNAKEKKIKINTISVMKYLSFSKTENYYAISSTMCLTWWRDGNDGNFVHQCLHKDFLSVKSTSIGWVEGLNCFTHCRKTLSWNVCVFSH